MAAERDGCRGIHCHLDVQEVEALDTCCHDAVVEAGGIHLQSVGAVEVGCGGGEGVAGTVQG